MRTDHSKSLCTSGCDAFSISHRLKHTKQTTDGQHKRKGGAGLRAQAAAGFDLAAAEATMIPAGGKAGNVSGTSTALDDVPGCGEDRVVHRHPGGWERVDALLKLMMLLSSFDAPTDRLVQQGTYARVAPRSGLAVKKMWLGGRFRA